jgi:Zn-finger nucleic acid-binding protein
VRTCPACGNQLSVARTPFGVVEHCEGCGGRMVGLATLRRDRVTDEFRTALWQAARSACPGGRRCPSCSKNMVPVQLPPEMAGLQLDVCKLCECVWFDPSEYQRLPHLPPPPPEKELSPEARQALAGAMLQGGRLKQQMESEARGVADVLGLVSNLFLGGRRWF